MLNSFLASDQPHAEREGDDDDDHDNHGKKHDINFVPVKNSILNMCTVGAHVGLCNIFASVIFFFFFFISPCLSPLASIFCSKGPENPLMWREAMIK